jgi:hypothetical protein
MAYLLEFFEPLTAQPQNFCLSMHQGMKRFAEPRAKRPEWKPVVSGR